MNIKIWVIFLTRFSSIALKLLCVCFLCSAEAFAFVENVSHGYPNCMTCHISPAGGGVLTDYGRSLSKELMSTFGTEISEKPLFGFLPESEAWKFGGDIRFIQTHFENDSIVRGRVFEMQKNVELAFIQGPVTVVSALGTYEGPKGTRNKGELVSERHYLLVNIAETSYLRTGKFRTSFGINDPNHNRVTKSNLGFNPYSEPYNVEGIHFTDLFEFFLGAQLGRFDGTSRGEDEKGLYGNASWYMNDTSRVGLQVFFGRTDEKNRSILGFNGIISLPLKSVAVFEVDWQKTGEINQNKRDKTGVASTLRWNFVAGKGFTLYLINEYAKMDLSKKSVAQSGNGLGVQWMPFPHFDIQAEFQRVIRKTPEVSFANSAWFLTHFYF